MSRYEKLKKKYAELIPRELEKNKTILIESFVEYYGEDYRAIIQKRYNEITFVYYIDWECINVVVDEFIPQVEDKGRYQDFIRFLAEYRKKDNLWEKVWKKNTIQDDLPDNFIGITNKEVLNKREIKSKVLKAISIPQPSHSSFGSSKHRDQIVSFQILSLGPWSIIHEINHAITNDSLALLTENNGFIGAIDKRGLSIDVCSQNNGEQIIEELLNEKASFEIARIFKRRGGDFSSFCFEIPFENSYEKNFYLINDFYEQFKSHIKTARISENKNGLIARVGKEEYEQYVRLINENYSVDLNEIIKKKKVAMPHVKGLIEKMKTNEESSVSLSSTSLNSYYEQLKQLGYRVRLLNEMSNVPKDNLERKKTK